MHRLGIACALSTLGLFAAFAACGGGSETNPGGGSTTSSSSSSSSSGNTGGGGSAPLGGVIVAPLMPSNAESQQLFRMKPDGSELVQLTQTGDAGMPTDNNDFPVLSPDGKTIVFASGRDHAPEVNPMRRAIYVMDADGGNVHRLTTAPTELCNEYPGDLSPDGQWVVFTRACDGSIDPLTSNLDKLFRIKLDGTGEEKLAPTDPLVTSSSNQNAPVFTVDGKAVLFVSGDPAAEIYELVLATQKITQLTKLGDEGRSAAVRRPLVAPKGDVVYTQTMTTLFSEPRMEAVKLDGSGSTVLFEIPTDAGSLAFTFDRFALSPDGSAFLFALSKSSTEESLVITGLDGKNPKTIYPSTAFVGWGDPSWR